MKFSELENKTIQELDQMFRTAKADLVTLNFERANKSLKDNSQIQKKRKIIARLLTMAGKIKYNNES